MDRCTGPTGGPEIDLCSLVRQLDRENRELRGSLSTSQLIVRDQRGDIDGWAWLARALLVAVFIAGGGKTLLG